MYTACLLILTTLVTLTGNAHAATGEPSVKRPDTHSLSATSLTQLETAFFTKLERLFEEQVIQEAGKTKLEGGSSSLPLKEVLKREPVQEEAKRKVTDIKTAYDRTAKSLSSFCTFAETLVTTFTKPYDNTEHESQLAAAGYTAWRDNLKGFWCGMKAAVEALLTE